MSDKSHAVVIGHDDISLNNQINRLIKQGRGMLTMIIQMIEVVVALNH